MLAQKCFSKIDTDSEDKQELTSLHFQNSEDTSQKTRSPWTQVPLPSNSPGAFKNSKHNFKRKSFPNSSSSVTTLKPVRTSVS